MRSGRIISCFMSWRILNQVMHITRNPVHTQTKSLSNSSVEFLPTKSPHADFGQNTVIFAPVVHLLCPDSRQWERLVFNFAKSEVCEANFIKSFCFMIFPKDVLKTKRPRFSNQKTYLPEKGHQHRRPHRWVSYHFCKRSRPQAFRPTSHLAWKP